MKKQLSRTLGGITLLSLFMFGCASSNEETTTVASGNTAVDESMAGRTSDNEGLGILIVQEQITVPVTSMSLTALSMENTVDINDMFDDIQDTEQHDVLALAKTSPNLSTFVKLVERANLTEAIKRLDKVTIFAPTNEAFAKMPRAELESMLKSENIALLSRMLQTHILASEVSAGRLSDNTRITISENSYIPIEIISPGSVRVGGAQLLSTDIEASNGRIHVIDSVILPDENIREEGTVR